MFFPSLISAMKKSSISLIPLSLNCRASSNFDKFVWRHTNMLHSFVVVFFYLRVFQTHLLLFLKSCGENEFEDKTCQDIRLPFNIKSLNSMQKYPHIPQSYVCIF